MNEYHNIQNKLSLFYKKYYINELIKGLILFISLGLIYFLFTVYLEYFLWLTPFYRTVLFWFFVAVEGFLIFKLILTPLFHLIKIKKGINQIESSRIIGDHFPEVKDKLLNVLQLKKAGLETDLLTASIEQKSKELQPIQFSKAVNFKKNLKFTRYLLIPIIIWMISLLSGTSEALTSSFTRVVNHKKEFLPPAPFSFELENNNLDVIQGNSLTINVATIGDIVPEQAKIAFGNQAYFMQEKERGVFSFTFNNVTKPIEFTFSSNKVTSKTYTLEILKTPTIQNITLDLDYPSYTKKTDETINNSGNLLVPEGTKIKWEATTNQTDTVMFFTNNKRIPFIKNTTNTFTYSLTPKKNIQYQISSSNQFLQDFEKLSYSINIVKDEFPTIVVQSNIDSIGRGDALFAGQISDDYGITQLDVFYYKEDFPNLKKKISLQINKEKVQTFFYDFPNQLSLDKGVSYGIYFQVSDNDRVNGRKRTTSKKFIYRQKTEEEVDEEILEDQKNTIKNLEQTIQNQKKQKEKLNEIQKELQNKKDINWNDKKKVDEFIKRQNQYEQMMKRQTENLQESLEEKKEENQTFKAKKNELQKRIEELKKLNKQKKLLDELQKLSEKLDKEEIVRKAKQLAQENKQQERSLERILELTKRFYVEEKTMQIANKLDQLSKKQDSINNDKSNALEKQKEINKSFDKISKELEELSKDNQKLKEPMEIPEMEDIQEETKEELSKSQEKLKQQQKKQAQNNQKNASKKMKQMSQRMQKAMSDMQANSIDENIDDLRKILENLVTFSFQQEDLMKKFDNISVRHPDFGKELKKQNELKTYFEHVDDSLYVLSMRLPQLSAKIQTDLSDAHYNLDESLENFSENRFNSGSSNQQYVMTAVNNLSDFLSNLLNNMQNSSSSSGKGKSGGKSFSLPTLIQGQKGLSEQMKKGVKKGEKGKGGKKAKQGKGNKGGKEGKEGKGGKNGGQGNGDDENMNGELFKIYQQQSTLRQQLQDAINSNGGSGDGAKKALKTMEQLENDILEKGFSQQVLQRMQQLEYELLKLDKAAFEQGKDKKRKSNTNNTNYQKKKIKQLQLKKLFYNQIEILNRQSLPLRQNFEKKVQEYFSKKTKE